jgi:hypothetical protein
MFSKVKRPEGFGKGCGMLFNYIIVFAIRFFFKKIHKQKFCPVSLLKKKFYGFLTHVAE